MLYVFFFCINTLCDALRRKHKAQPREAHDPGNATQPLNGVQLVKSDHHTSHTPRGRMSRKCHVAQNGAGCFQMRYIPNHRLKKPMTAPMQHSPEWRSTHQLGICQATASKGTCTSTCNTALTGAQDTSSTKKTRRSPRSRATQQIWPDPGTRDASTQGEASLSPRRRMSQPMQHGHEWYTMH
jgi:hypothetical protein